MNQARSPTLPSFSGLSSAVKEAREYENSRRTPGRNTRTEAQDNNSSNSSNLLRRSRPPSSVVPSPVSAVSVTEAPPADGFDRSAPKGALGKTPFAHGNTSALLLQDTLSPLLEEVDALFEKGQEIAAGLKAQGNRMQEDDVSRVKVTARACAAVLGLLPRDLTGILCRVMMLTMAMVMIVGDARPETVPVFGLRLRYIVNPGELGLHE